MDDFSPELREEVVRALRQLGVDANLLAKIMSTTADVVKKHNSKVTDLDKSLDKLNKKAEQNTASMGGLFKEMLSGRKIYKDLNYDLESLNDRIDDLNEQIEEASKLKGKEADELKKKLQKEAAQAEQARVLLQTTIEHNAQLQRTTNGLAGLTSTLTKGVVGAFTGAAKSALNGSDALTTATGFMTAGIDMANNATQAGSKSLGEFGQGAILAGGKLGKFGIAATVASTALSFLSNTTSELAKAGIGFMLTQTQKLIAGFQTASAVGAVYTGGMMEMIKTSTEAGMTLDQFGKALGENRDAFTKSGLGVSEGSKRMADAMKSGGRAARDGMFALGMGMEEQADAYATVMARAAGPMGKLSVSSAVVAQLTEGYAKDLKLISDLTGKSAAEQKKLADERTNEFRFQQELAKLSAEDRTKTEAAVAGMTEDSAKALKDRIQNFGAVTDTNMAVLESASPTLRQYHQEQYDLFKSGKLTAEADLTLKQKYRESIQKELAAREDLGQASAHGLSGFNALATGVMKEFAQGAGKSVKDAQTAIDAQVEKGKSGKGTEVDLMGTQQNFAMEMQKIAEKNLPAFSDAIVKTIESIQGAVGALAGGGVAAGSFFGDLTNAIVAGVSGAIGPLMMAGAMGKAGGAGGMLGSAGDLLGKGGAAGGGAANKLMGGGIKVGAKGIVSAGGKVLGKLLPGVGLVTGSYEAYESFKAGDKTGAAIAMAGGLASLIPGVGGLLAAGVTTAYSVMHEPKPKEGAEPKEKDSKQVAAAKTEIAAAEQKQTAAKRELSAARLAQTAADEKLLEVKEKYAGDTSKYAKAKIAAAEQEALEAARETELATIKAEAAGKEIQNAKDALSKTKTDEARIKAEKAKAEADAAAAIKSAEADLAVAKEKAVVVNREAAALKEAKQVAFLKLESAKAEYAKNKTEENKKKLEGAEVEAIALELKTELHGVVEAGSDLTLKNAKTKLETAKTKAAQLKAPAAQTGDTATDAAWGGTPSAATAGAEAAPATPKAGGAGGATIGKPDAQTGKITGGDAGAPGDKTPNPATAPKKSKGAAAGGANMSDDEIKKMIVAHEGIRTKPYKDSLGLWTVGVGHLIGDGKTLPADWDREFSKEEVMALFDKDYAEHKRAAESRTPKFDKMTGAGQGAFTDLTFNMGPNWLSKWPKLKAQIEAEDTQGMTSNLAGSTWAKQVKSRSNDIIALAEQAFPKMAKGGITDGTSIAGEAGPEAVVPLPDGRTIPVTMDISQLVQKMDEMIEILREQYESSDSDKLDEMIRVLKDQHSTSEKILQISA